jgi:uncharacterized protein (DUF2249 family)
MMHNKMIQRKDLFILLFSFSLLLFLILLYFYYSGYRTKKDLEPVGSIVYRHKVVQRKDYSGFLWESIKQGEEVYNNDSIRTDESAEAILILKNQIRIELDPYSMIVLNIRDEKTELELIRGTISIHVLNSQSVLLKAGELKFSSIEGKMKVKIVGDALEFQNEKSVKIVDSPIEKVLDGGKTYTWGHGQIDLKEYPIKLISPVDNYRFFPDSKEPIIFQWESDKSLKTLELSTDSNFQRIRNRVEVQGNSEKISLEDGSYFWRVVSGEQTSETRRIRVYTKKKLELNTPIPKSELNLELPANIYFSWNTLEMAKEYRVVISQSEKLENSEEFLSSRNGIAIPIVKEGKYYFQLHSISSIPELNTSTEIYSIQVHSSQKGNQNKEGKPKELKKEQTTNSIPKDVEKENKEVVAKKEIPLNLLYPANGSTIDMAKLNSLKFKWTSLGEGTIYSLKLFQLNSGKNQILSKELSESSFNLQDLGQLDIGNFEWEIEAQNPKVPDFSIKKAVARFKIILSEELEKPNIN